MRAIGSAIAIGVLIMSGVSCLPSGEAATQNVAVDKVGERCKVQFRRDALGAANPNGVPPLTDSMNGADTSVFGTLTFADETWVVVNNETTGEMWIPTSTVLLLQFPKS